MKRHKMKRGNQARTWIRASTSLINLLRSVGGNEPLPFGWACTASTIAALAADLTSVAAPLVCACVVEGVGALPLGPLGTDLALALDLLLLDGGAVEGPPVDEDDSGFFTTVGAELELLG